jgi:hypothetical protein
LAQKREIKRRFWKQARVVRRRFLRSRTPFQALFFPIEDKFSKSERAFFDYFVKNDKKSSF